MVSEFKWPSSIPSGQRTYKTPSCLIRKSIESIEIELSDGTINLLDENSSIPEVDRLVLITGAIGIFSGIKNSLYGGLATAAWNNMYGIYPGGVLKIKWASKDKNDLTCSVTELLDLIDKLGSVLSFSAN